MAMKGASNIFLSSRGHNADHTQLLKNKGTRGKQFKRVEEERARKNFSRLWRTLSTKGGHLEGGIYKKALGIKV